MVKGLSAEWGMWSRTVALNTIPLSLACWNSTIAVGLRSCKIILINAITGSHLSVLSKNRHSVRSITFSMDGTLLASGYDDKTVLLWDVQTGGMIKSFHGHTEAVQSVSISSDHATIASGSSDKTICLWDIQTGMRRCVINRHEGVESVAFSPTNSQLLMSASEGHTIEQWDANGQQIGSTYDGDGVTFSPDGTCFISWRSRVAIVRNSETGAVVAKLEVPSGKLNSYCFSPNGNLLAGSAGRTIYIWDITGSNPHLIKTLVGHTGSITSLTFSSSLISASEDKSVRFWQIDTSPTVQIATDMISTPPTPTGIWSTSLQARDGVAITSDAPGEVKIWDLTTGLCKASFKTPAKGICRDARLIEGRLIYVWLENENIHIWDVEKKELVQTINPSVPDVAGLRISGDGSKVFCLSRKFILAGSMWTGDIIGKVELESDSYLDPLCADGSKILVCLRDSSLLQGWDFGTSDPSPIPPSSTALNRPRLDLVDGHKWRWISPNKVKDVVTGEEVFQLAGRYGKPLEVRWDGRYLVAGYRSGEVLILDLNSVLPQ